MNRETVEGSVPHDEPRYQQSAAAGPGDVPIGVADNEDGHAADHSDAQAGYEIIDPDARHRMVSDPAYALYARRGYADGFDVEDWLSAEAEATAQCADRAGRLH